MKQPLGPQQEAYERQATELEDTSPEMEEEDQETKVNSSPNKLHKQKEQCYVIFPW